jgi:NADPH-dependent 2,4-dienoyl-CoA reductase/sulfur reductase-like enzyme
MGPRIRLGLWCVHTSCWEICRARADLATEEKDLIIIGGGVAGYVAAIKAGQEGLKVRMLILSFGKLLS